MKLNDLRDADTVHQEDLANDPAYRREYLSTRFANQVAVAVMRWRTERGLTQTKLAELLGMRQPHIARLEAGEHTPSLENTGASVGPAGHRDQHRYRSRERNLAARVPAPC